MSAKDYFQITIKNLIRENKNIFYIIITVICTIITLSSLVFRYNFSNYINDSFTKNIGFRTLAVSPILEIDDLGKEKLSTIDHVDDVYSIVYYSKLLDSNLSTDNLDGTISFLYGTVKSSPNVIAGRGFEENERNVAICPINFYPDEDAYDLKINSDYIIDGNDLLNKNFTVTYYSRIYDNDQDRIFDDKKFEKTFKVIGLYNNKQTMDFNNQCYIPAEDMTEIVDIGRPVDPTNQTSYPYFYVVVDSLYNLESVMDKISELGFDESYVKNEININLINTVDISGNVILTIVLVTILLLTSSYIKKKILNETRVIGVLRTSGYNKKIVRNIYLLETILINLFSYIIGLILFIITYSILVKTLFSTVSYIGIMISINPLSILLSLAIIIVLSSIVAIFHISKKCHLDIVKLVGSEE